MDVYSSDVYVDPAGGRALRHPLATVLAIAASAGRRCHARPGLIGRSATRKNAWPLRDQVILLRGLEQERAGRREDIAHCREASHVGRISHDEIDNYAPAEDAVARQED